MTLDLYSHVTPRLQEEEATARMQQLPFDQGPNPWTKKQRKRGPKR
jgi:hypothetical protein